MLIVGIFDTGIQLVTSATSGTGYQIEVATSIADAITNTTTHVNTTTLANTRLSITTAATTLAATVM